MTPIARMDLRDVRDLSRDLCTLATCSALSVRIGTDCGRCRKAPGSSHKYPSPWRETDRRVRTGPRRRPLRPRGDKEGG
ncbi:hypothetical protein, partial [Streptomyces albus]|uniref:hypothetical protein n=2 Tax=Streptomyces albus TaxID=1888 RepID=UPI0039F10172